MATDETIVVNFAELRHAGDSIEHALSAMRQQLGDVERDARPLVATWAGPAQEAYSARQASWRQAADDLTMMLRDIKRALDESALGYRDIEDRNVRRFE